MARSLIIPIPHGTTATKLAAPEASDSYGGNTLAIQNVGTVLVRVGGSDVATANGWPVAAGGTLVIDVGDDLYAIVDTGTDGSIALLRTK